jgi:hypothetical protein
MPKPNDIPVLSSWDDIPVLSSWDEKPSSSGPSLSTFMNVMKAGASMPSFLANQTVVKGADRAYHGAKEGVLNTQGRPAGRRWAQAAHEVIAGTGQATLPLAAPALITNPVGLGLGVAGGYLGGQGGEWLAKQANLDPEYVSLAGDAGSILGGAVATRPGVVDAVRSAPGRVAGVTADAASQVLGRTTGAGPKPLQQAFKNPTPELQDQMRNPDASALLDTLKAAAKNAADQRGDAYRADLERMQAKAARGQASAVIPADKAPILNALDKKLVEYRVGKTNDGGLDFSSSPIGKSGQADIQELNDLIRGWKDWTPLGLDSLKRRIGGIYSENGEARGMVSALRSDVKSTVGRMIPEYGKMTADYEKATQFLNNVKDLSLDSKNQGMAIRKITTLLNQNNDFREGVINALQQYSNSDLQGQVSGLALSRVGPRGIGGALDAAALLSLIANGSLSPTGIGAMAATSPRLMGEAAYALGRGGQMASRMGSRIPNAPIHPGTGAAVGNSTRQLMDILRNYQK